MFDVRRPTAALILLGCLTWTAGLRGQAPPAGDKPAEPPATKVREQTIYIPYTKLREVFEKEGRGVFLPYEKFQELWRAAREKQSPAPPDRPPVAALISDVDSEATVGKDVVQVKAVVKIEVLAKGWSEVPLGLGDAALQSAKIGEEPARIVPDGAGGYKLLWENKEDKATQIELVLNYAKAFTKAPGQNSVSFLAPQAAVNRWRIRIPEAGAKVTIDPLLAATEVPAAKAPDAAPADAKNQTEVLAFVGAAQRVRIDWTHKAEGAAGLAALVSVESQHQAVVDEGLVRTQARLTYGITRADLAQLVIETPADQKVVNVLDANVRQWSVEKQGEVQHITVQLFEPARGSQSVIVELEKLFDDKGAKDLVVPLVKAVGAGRQQGIVAVRLADSLRGQPSRRTGLLQIDAGELPQHLAGGQWHFVYRFASVPWDLALAVDKVLPRINVDQLVEAYLEPNEITINLLALYNIERAGAYELQLEVPEEYEVRHVRGHTAAGAEAVQVDAFHLLGEKKQQLTVNLARKALGKVCLLVELHRRLSDPNLLGPTGEASDISVPIPRVVPASVERSTGRLIVSAPESLRINVGAQEGLRSVSLQEALEGVESCKGQRFGSVRPVLSMTFADGPASLSLSVLRRKPQVTAAQLLLARIDAGVVKYEARFQYDIRFSGVKSLRIDIPADLASEVRNATPAMTEKVIDPPPADLAKGYVAWSLTGETELLGAVAVLLTWERRIEKLDIGKTVSIDVPRLKPMEVDRGWGQIVLVKAETIDVLASGEPRGLRPIDPQHDLMPGANVADAARAFEFHGDWALTLSATHYKLEAVKRTSIERAIVRTWATRGGQLAVQAQYRVRSTGQRMPLTLPNEKQVVFDTEPVRINGKAVTLERGAKSELFVPLVGIDPEQAFLLELRYTTDGDASNIALPSFEDAAVQKVYLCAYLPEEWALLGSRGPWTDEQASSDAPVRTSDADLAAWVVEGLSVAGSPADAFAKGGRLYVFSTLQPAKGDEGALHLTTINRKWLAALVFGLVVAVGLVLARRPLCDRLVAVAALVISLVLLGVFLPTLSRHVTGPTLWLGLVLVAAVWTIVAAFGLRGAMGDIRSRWAAARAKRASAAEPPPPESPAEDRPSTGDADHA